MKHLLLLTVLFTSCTTSTYYYQLYKADGGKIENDRVVFEDDNCKILYDLWAENGDIGFNFYNKTDENIKLDLEQSFFVLNGLAHPYYRNGVHSRTVETNTSAVTYFYVTKSVGTNETVSFSDVQSQYVPPKTSVRVGTYNIVNVRFDECDFKNYPTSAQTQVLKFGQKDSPYIFSNSIMYEANGRTHKAENNFYVSEITNKPRADVMTIKTDKCGKKNTAGITVFKDFAPNEFYYKYAKL